MSAAIPRFVIVGWPRSGTTALVSYLDSHPQIACYHELFNDRHLVVPWLEPVALMNQVFSTGVLIRDLGAPGSEDEQAMRVLNRPHDGRCGSVGFKLLVNQAYAAPALCQEIARQQEIGVILLYRVNALRKLVSARLAMGTGQWNSRSPQVSNVKVKISIRQLIHSARTDELLRQHVLNFVALAGNPVFHLTYEELSSDPEATLGKLQHWLGVDIHRLVTQFQRINTRPLRAVIENYDELAEEIRSAGLSRFLDDETLPGRDSR